MKATYKFVIAALAATLALASCTKETAEPGIADSATKGVRTIAVSFGNSTKSSLWDGPTPLTPTFKVDDEICVAKVDGSADPQTCKVIPGEGGILVIETNLEGKLDAVYPATAAVVVDNRITGINVPTLQSGTFAEANICQATIPAGSSNAEFENKVSILKFYVDASIGVLGLKITAAEEFELVVQPDINVKSASAAYTPLYTSTDDPSKRISYVAVSPGVYENFTVSSYTTTQDAYEDMAVVKEFGDVTFAKGTIYNVFIPYYIKVLVGSDENGDVFQYWSYCNLGAFLPEEAGYYFSWGNNDGHWRNGVRDNNYSFDENTYNATPGATLTADIDPNSERDAAKFAWSGKWRMPTNEEYETLLNESYVSRQWKEDFPYTGSKGKLFTDKLDNQLFFPAAKIIKYGEMDEYGACGYWTSVYGENASKANFDQYNNWDGIHTAGRLFGLPIRPIYGEPRSTVDISINPIAEGDRL